MEDQVITLNNRLFRMSNIDKSNKDFDIIEVTSFVPETPTKALKHLYRKEIIKTAFKVQKGKDLYSIDRPIFNLTEYIKSYTANDINKINITIESSIILADLSKEKIGEFYFVDFYNYMTVYNDFIDESSKKRSGLSFLKDSTPLILLSGNDGYAHFCAGKVVFESDGSGFIANGNIVWDAMGNLLTRGTFESNKNGNKIVIDPSTRNIQLISPDKGLLGDWSFFSNGSILRLLHKPSDVQIDETQLNGNTISFSMRNIVGGSSYHSRIGVTGMKFDINIFPTKNRLSELEIGELYRDGDVIKIKIN